MSHQRWRDSAGRARVAPGLPGLCQLFNILFILRNSVSSFQVVKGGKPITPRHVHRFVAVLMKPNCFPPSEAMMRGHGAGGLLQRIQQKQKSS